MKLNNLVSNAKPIADYELAVKGIEALQSGDDDSINPKARTRLFTHGKKTERAVLWFHGYTNSPRQFEELSRDCFEQGANVFIPRLPYHGKKDRLTRLHGKITAEGLANFADECLSLACGLGSSLVVGGLSMGGVITAWLAQQRREIARAVILSPAMGFLVIPDQRTRRVAEIMLFLPDQFRWWEPELKDQRLEPADAYPQYSRRALAQTLRLGFAVQKMAAASPPAAQKIWVVTNDNDDSVDHTSIRRVINNWREQGFQNVHESVFPSHLELPHDLIDPTQPKQNIDLVYPILLKGMWVNPEEIVIP